MSRSKITILLGQGNVKGNIANNDGISAFQFYGTAPGSFATTACQAVFSISDAVTKGIVNTHLGETKAAGSIAWGTGSSLGTLAAGDTITVSLSEKNPNGVTTPITLCVYTVVSADVTDATGATLNTAITAAINANTYLTATSGTGYVASAATNVTTITARAGLGINLNTTSPVVAISNGHTMTNTIVAFTGGVYSKCDIWYYTLNRFFTRNPNGKAWVQFTASPSSTYAEVSTLLNAAGGEPRLLGILNFTARTAANVTADLNLIQSQFAASFTSYKACDIFYVPNVAAISDPSTLQNLQALGNAQNILPVISQDGDAAGAQLYVNSGVSVSNIGDIIGLASVLAVSQDIGEVGVGNISDGVENNLPALTNGVLIGSLASSVLDQLDSYRYLFCTGYTGTPGTYINNDWTAIIQTNTYNRLCVNRVINKVSREQYKALLPLLKSRVYLNKDGTIDNVTLNKYYAAAEPGIEQMVKDGDLSPGNLTGTALTAGVVSIDPTQNVRTQGYIAIVYNLLGVDIADNINVTLQFVQSL